MNAAAHAKIRTVLILDDDPVSRKAIGKILELIGIRQRVEAKSGAEASKALDTFTPDLAVVDGLLPDTDGLSWIRKERPRLPPHVVFASGFWKHVRSDSQLGRELGISAVLHKPFTVSELSGIVAALAGRRGGTRSA